MQKISRNQKAQNIRSVIRYINKFKNAVLVIYLDDEVINSPLFSSHIRDIAIIHQAGIKVVLVPGSKKRTDQVLTDFNLSWNYKNNIRITSENAILLDHIGNANNFGAIVRSAAFFGIKNIIIPQDETKSAITTSSYRIAEGGMEYVTIYSVKSMSKLLQALKGKMKIIGTDLTAKKSSREIKKICDGMPALMILGNEEHGISDEVRKNCDELIIIPFFGMKDGEVSQVDSLNVAQASSILFYELSC